jgi:hypothetical protein
MKFKTKNLIALSLFTILLSVAFVSAESNNALGASSNFEKNPEDVPEGFEASDWMGQFWAPGTDEGLHIKGKPAEDPNWIALFSKDNSCALGASSNFELNPQDIPEGFEASDWMGQFWAGSRGITIKGNPLEPEDPKWVALFSKDNSCVLGASSDFEKNPEDVPEGFEASDWMGQFWSGPEGLHIKGKPAEDPNWIALFVKQVEDEEPIKIKKKSSSSKKKKLESCEPVWQCSGWTECNDGVRTRNCRDINFCEFSLNKPLETIGCEDLSLINLNSDYQSEISLSSLEQESLWQRFLNWFSF